MSIEQLSAQIHALQQKKQELVSKELEENQKELKSLIWLQGCKLYFTFRQYGVYGNTEYVLWGGPCPKGLNSQYLTLKGDSVHYFENIILSGEYSALESRVFEIRSCNPKLFAEFVEENDLQIEPDATFRKHVQVLNTVLDQMQ